MNMFMQYFVDDFVICHSHLLLTMYAFIAFTLILITVNEYGIEFHCIWQIMINKYLNIEEI